MRMVIILTPGTMARRMRSEIGDEYEELRAQVLVVES